MIKVLIADDQVLLAESLKSVLQTADDIEVCGTVFSGLEAVEACKKLRPDVALMDIRMPEMNGVVATKRIKEENSGIKIIMLTTFDDSEYILSAINNGASGYLLKDIGANALIDAVRNAYAGDTILPSKIARKITAVAANVNGGKKSKLREMFNLSDREIEIAIMLADGFTNRQIANALKLSDGTVRNYISSIYLQLGVDNRVSAAEKILRYE